MKYKYLVFVVEEDSSKEFITDLDGLLFLYDHFHDDDTDIRVFFYNSTGKSDMEVMFNSRQELTERLGSA
jgi:hypothetical protein